MNIETGSRPILHLPPEAYPESSAELFRQRRLREAAANPNKRVIPSLSLIVNISAEMVPDGNRRIVPQLEPELRRHNFVPTPQPSTRELSYFLSATDTQPVILNGFVWSCYADGSRHSVQHFIAGVDTLGGLQPHVHCGVVNIYLPGDILMVCKYAWGHCRSVTMRNLKA
jgi:hypothetical protein